MCTRVQRRKAAKTLVFLSIHSYLLRCVLSVISGWPTAGSCLCQTCAKPNGQKIAKKYFQIAVEIRDALPKFGLFQVLLRCHKPNLEGGFVSIWTNPSWNWHGIGCNGEMRKNRPYWQLALQRYQSLAIPRSGINLVAKKGKTVELIGEELILALRQYRSIQNPSHHKWYGFVLFCGIHLNPSIHLHSALNLQNGKNIWRNIAINSKNCKTHLTVNQGKV